MTNTTDEIGYFPATAPAAFQDGDTTAALVAPVLTALAEVVDVPVADLDRPTPCARYTVRELRDHVLGWLQLFAAAFDDPDRRVPRPDADGYRAADDARDPSQVVRAAADRLLGALDDGVLRSRIVMSQARMDGSAVAAMALGEYVIHGWDLATATGRAWSPSEAACTLSLEFFSGMITPEYRGDGEGGFFDVEVAVPDDAPVLDRLLGFAGRDPRWTPPA
jgi:uncharacterized protein (TIGR03086 family)